jgi:hypothetical protein
MSAILFIRANVASYDKWRRAYDDALGFRRENGVREEMVYCSPTDMTSLLVLHYFDSVSAAEAFVNHPDLAAATKERGIIGASHMTITSVVE